MTSQTSLPSHTGPTVSSIVRRSSSSRATNGSSMPTPKSNPSSTKYVAQKTPIRQNQKTSSVTAPPSLREHRRALLGDDRRVDAREAAHQDEVEHGEHRVEEQERAEAERHG